MRNLVRAELLKLRTTRMFYGIALAALALVPVSVAISILSADGSAGKPALDTSEGVRQVMSAASAGTVVILIIGILMMAGEFRHNTATSTFLISPDRKRVVGAKLIAATLVGAVLAVIAALVTLAVAIPWLAAKHVHVSVFSADVGYVLMGAVAATALYALVGVGLGSLIRNQTAAVVVALLWVMVVEGLLISFVSDVGKWLPGGAVAALTGVATLDGGLLPMWGGALLFTAYGLVFAAAGSQFVMQRDIA
jgi:ABC-type transport system involved in multi-copper enzyme maturation permease subunit